MRTPSATPAGAWSTAPTVWPVSTWWRATASTLWTTPRARLKAYDAGIRLVPGEGLLYFNRAVTLLNQDKPGPAVDDLQRALYRKPNHPTSHLLLGQIWYQQDNRIPALLALLRFLELEPASGRSADALRIVTDMLNELVQVAGEGDEQKIEIALRAKTPKKEGTSPRWRRRLGSRWPPRASGTRRISRRMRDCWALSIHSSPWLARRPAR